MKKIALAGSTQLARRLIYYIQEIGYGQIAGMFDDFEKDGSMKYDHQILGKLNDIETLYKRGCFDEIMVAIGYNNIAFRKKIFSTLKKQAIPVGTFVHPTAYVADSAKIGEGCILLINCIVEMNTVLRENIFLSSSCYVSHDVRIGAHTYCAPSLNIAGNSTIGEGCFLGINTTTVNGVRVGNNVKIGAGSVIIKDIPSNVLVAGVPAVVRKEF